MENKHEGPLTSVVRYVKISGSQNFFGRAPPLYIAVRLTHRQLPTLSEKEKTLVVGMSENIGRPILSAISINM